jgi:hypothetical protein
MLQLLVCDWLLAARTEVWERRQAGEEEVEGATVSQTELIAFQHDLASLRKVAQQIKTALPRVSTSTTYKKQMCLICLVVNPFNLMLLVSPGRESGGGPWGISSQSDSKKERILCILIR